MNHISAASVLKGIKQTFRRPMDPQPKLTDWAGATQRWLAADGDGHISWLPGKKPLNPSPLSPIKIGDRFVMQEPWAQVTADGENVENVVFRSDCHDLKGDLWTEILMDPTDVEWEPVGKMPDWAVRFTGEITGISMEQLLEVTELDAASEGFHSVGSYTARENFLGFWDSVYSTRGFGIDANPWVMVYQFKRVEVGNEN